MIQKPRWTGTGFARLLNRWLTLSQQAFLLIVLVSLMISGPVLGIGISRLIQASSEPPIQVPCQILSSAFTAKKYAGKGTVTISYEPQICFHFLLNDQPYQSCRYSYYWGNAALPYGTDTTEAARQIVQNNPSGSRQNCSVNPAQPDGASLTLGSREALFQNAYTLMGMGLGMFLLFLGLMKWAEARKRFKPEI